MFISCPICKSNMATIKDAWKGVIIPGSVTVQCMQCRQNTEVDITIKPEIDTSESPAPKKAETTGNYLTRTEAPSIPAG